MADRIDISATVRAIDQASGPLRSIANQIRNVGDVAKTAGASLAKMATQPFGSVSQNLRGVGSAVSGLASNFKALWSPIGAFIGIAGIGGAIAAMKDFMNTARQLQKVATATGASPEMIQTWRYMVGDVEAADKSLTMLQKNLANFATKGGKANQRIIDVLAKMGISMKDVRSGAIGMDEILPKIAAGFEKNTNAASRAAVGQALFGRNWAQIVPMLAKGRDGIEAARQELEKLGYLTAEQTAAGAALKNSWRELTQVGTNLTHSVFAGMAQYIQPLIDGMRDWMIEMRPAIIEGVTNAAREFGRVLGFLWQGIQQVVGVMGGWENTIAAVGAAFAVKLMPDIWELGKALLKLGGSTVFNPITLAALGLGAAAVAVRRNWATIGPWLEEQFGSLPPAAQQAFTAISRWAETAWKDLVAGWKRGGLVGAVTAGIFSAGRQIYQNWDAISEWLQGTFPAISVAAQTAWNNITTWWGTSVQNIRQAWESGGLLAAMEATWEAVRTGATSAAAWIHDQHRNIDWNAIRNAAANAASWIRDQFQRIDWAAIGANAAERFRQIDWAAIGRFAENAFNAAWRTQATLAQWTADALRNIDWGGIATFAGNAFVAAWQGALNLVEWLRGLDWENAGYVAGQAIANALNAAMEALAKIDEWAARQDWGAVAAAIYRGLDAMVSGFVEIGARFMAGLINGMIDAIPGLRQVVDGITSFFDRFLPAFVKRAIGWGQQDMVGALQAAAAAPAVTPAEGAFAAIPPAAIEEALSNVVGQMKDGLSEGAAAALAKVQRESALTRAQQQELEQTSAQIIPFPERKPTPPGAAPLAPTLAPTVAQPNVLQGMKEIPVRLAGEIAQRLRVDMSPDLRAMLEENRSKIDQLGVQVRTAVDVGVSMGPAMGEAA